jgi:hypothetical protein
MCRSSGLQQIGESVVHEVFVFLVWKVEQIPEKVESGPFQETVIEDSKTSA